MKTKIVTLKEFPDLRKPLINLIESSFSYSSENKFDIDFYPLLASSNEKNSYIMIDENSQKIIAHVGVIPKQLISKGISIPALFLGGIAVDTDYRRRGFFNSTLSHVLNNHLGDAAIAILWSNLVSMYEKMQFYPAIGLIENCATDEIGDDWEPKTYSSLSAAEQQQIQAIYRQMSSHYIVVKRQEADWESIQKITSSNLYIRKDESGKIVSYFFKDKGQDLENVIHEFGFKDEAAKKDLFTNLKKTISWLPEKERSSFPDGQLCSSALIKIGDPDLFCKLVKDWSNDAMSVTDLSVETVNFTFSGSSHQMEVAQFLPLLLGPNPAEEFKHFDRSIFISGLDSI